MLELTLRESKRLVRLESTIEKGMATFRKVGAALGSIRDDRLYRATHATFETYCNVRWGFSRQRANQLITAERVVNSLTTSGCQTSLNERQARELKDVAPEAAADIVEEAGDQATARTLRDLVEKRRQEICDAEKGAANDRPSIDRPPRNRLAAIQKLYGKILREIDGSIDSVLADWIEANCKEALGKIEGYCLPLAA